MSLANKYRPTNFNEIVGNKEIIESLKKDIGKEFANHTYLFVGDRGCGKTSTARLMCKELGINDKAISEINCSNNTGVDYARELIDTFYMGNIYGKNKAYILDEFHKTSNAAQNCYLKPFEEPPKNVYIFLCSTEPQSIIDTIKSRTKQHFFKPPSTRDMIKHLQYISTNEGKEISTEIIRDILKTHANHPRDCINNLDIILDIEGEENQKKAIQSTSCDETYVKDICMALMKKEGWNKISELLKNIDGEPETIRRGILGYLNSALVGGWASNFCRNDYIYNLMTCFEYNFYDTGKNGLTMACFRGCSL